MHDNDRKFREALLSLVAHSAAVSTSSGNRLIVDQADVRRPMVRGPLGITASAADIRLTIA